MGVFVKDNVTKPLMPVKQKIFPNGAVELIPVPSGLLARRLRSRLWCQKQVGAGHRGR